MRGHRIRVLLTVMAGLGFLATGSLIPPLPLLIWNATASAPIGFYRVIHRATVQRGGFVLAQTPTWVRDLASRRGYLPANVPLVKRVAALEGDTICSDGDAVSINGREVAQRLKADREGRALPAWSGCAELGWDDVFVLMPDVRTSFDGRYFGPIKTSAIIGELVPVWTR
jgi:conjugative transfer signal peptidase TraF